MRINKLTGLGAGALVLLMTLEWAIAGPAPQQKQGSAANNGPPADRFEYMSRQLNLTADQKPKVRAIVDEQMQQWTTLEKNKTLNAKQKIEMMQAINQSSQGRIEKILTVAQKRKLDAIMAEARPQPGKPAKKPARKPSSGPREP
jgi:periplasmic protein CpxP/Spy